MDWAHLLANFSSLRLATLLLAMLPIAELRGAIPVALGNFDLSWLEAYLLAVVGNMIPVFFLLWFLEPFSRFLRKHFKIFDKFFTWLFERTKRRHKAAFQKWGPLALIVFVAIPLPVTGAWTGSVAAFVFNIPYRLALPLIFLGVLMAGGVVTLASLGLFTLFLP